MACFTRRDFLKRFGASMGAALAGRGLHLLPGTNVAYVAGARAAPDNTVVVFVQLGGGNDGINTVYPLNGNQRVNYQKYRTTLAMPALKSKLQPWVAAKLTGGQQDILDIGANDDGSNYAFHPAMHSLWDIYQQGKVAVLPGVHYPRPNHSHFESTNIYTSADPSGRTPDRGWFGKYMDVAAFVSTEIPAVDMGRTLTPLFVPTNAGLFTFRRIDELRFPANGEQALKAGRFVNLYRGAGARDEALTPELVSIGRTGDATVTHLLDYYDPGSGLAGTGRVAALMFDGGGKYSGENPLVYSSPLNPKDNPNVSGSGLASDLKHVAAVIRSNVGARFFHVSIDGFDTHSQQENGLFHSKLLYQVSEAVAAFYNDLKQTVTLPSGYSGYLTEPLVDKVVIVTFSEFGRTIRQNATDSKDAGTDHASSAPQFIIGGQVLGGQYGAYPQLDDPGFEARDDLKLTTDFRDVFGTVLSKWLNVATADIGPGPGKIFSATSDPDGDGNTYTAFTPMGFLP